MIDKNMYEYNKNIILRNLLKLIVKTPKYSNLTFFFRKMKNRENRINISISEIFLKGFQTKVLSPWRTVL